MIKLVLAGFLIFGEFRQSGSGVTHSVADSADTSILTLQNVVAARLKVKPNILGLAENIGPLNIAFKDTRHSGGVFWRRGNYKRSIYWTKFQSGPHRVSGLDGMRWAHSNINVPIASLMIFKMRHFTIRTVSDHKRGNEPNFYFDSKRLACIFDIKHKVKSVISDYETSVFYSEVGSGLSFANLAGDPIRLLHCNGRITSVLNSFTGEHDLPKQKANAYGASNYAVKRPIGGFFGGLGGAPLSAKIAFSFAFWILAGGVFHCANGDIGSGRKRPILYPIAALVAWIPIWLFWLV